ncbi:hypothetical protein RJ641_032726 [Dillenia turbinata]|uniref:Phytol kinase n=1 Tax=Dillenia turbinata TaxID=194707 RepID=A0AAN8VTV0_9MAGN
MAAVIYAVSQFRYSKHQISSNYFSFLRFSSEIFVSKFARPPLPHSIWSTPVILGGFRIRKAGNLLTGSMFSDTPIVNDIIATGFTGIVALSSLRLWQETAKHGIFDQKLNRKLMHISIGLIFMLCWPLFSPGRRGSYLAAVIPGLNIIKMVLVGSGICKDEATVKSMSRTGDYRELLKGPLYYATAITLASILYWRDSPLSISVICNLCAGDGLADVVGRRFGHKKLPYNLNKSVAGSLAMAAAGFVSCVVYMHYFSMFGYMEKSWEKVLGFLLVSSATALVESLPVSSELDDNLTVPLASILVGTLVF